MTDRITSSAPTGAANHGGRLKCVSAGASLRTNGGACCESEITENAMDVLLGLMLVVLIIAAGCGLYWAWVLARESDLADWD
jgi:hypothetical protein